MEQARTVPTDTSYVDTGLNGAATTGAAATHSNTGNNTSNNTATEGTAPAGTYLQQARDTINSLVGTAQQAVGIESPATTLASVADNTKIQPSAVSEESGNRPGEHVGGVGELPGSASETGIAVLPAERMSVPSRELEGAYPSEKTGGVGALPGSLGEEGVAVLPEERAVAYDEGSKTRSAAKAATHPHTEEPEKKDVKSAALHPIDTAKHVTNVNAANTTNTSNTSNTSNTPNVARTTDTSKSTASSPESRRSESLPATPSDSPTSPTGKVSMKDKMAGGVKVLTGKISKDQAKIAEGRALKEGHHV